MAEKKPSYLLPTFAERAAAARAAGAPADTKAVESDEVEDKAVGSPETKRRTGARKK